MTKGRSAKQRLGAIRRRKVFRRFGESLLGQMGFSGSDFKSSGVVKNKLGLFGGAISSKRKASDSGGLPKLSSPSTVSNKTNPNLSTIVTQLESLVKSARKLGVITKEQQKTLLNDILETRKLEKESFIENKNDSELIQGGGISSESLAPLSSAIEQLGRKLGLFDKVLDEKLDEQDSNGTFASRFFDSLGFGDEYDLYSRRKQAKIDRANSPENIKRSNAKALEKRASKFKPDQLLDKTGKPLTNNALAWRLGSLERERSRSSIFSKFKQSVSSISNKPAVGYIKGSVKRIAGPLISKTLGKTVLKSIPVIGIAAGIGFALDRLLKGDVIGAGLEAASGLMGPMTAIPAMVATITRDTYADVFGIQPEQDPEAPKRIRDLKKEVEDLVKETIGGQVDKKPIPPKAQIDDAFIGDAEKNLNKPVVESKTPPIPTPPVPPIASKPSGTSGTSGQGVSSSGSTQAPPAPASAGGMVLPEKKTGHSLMKQTVDNNRKMNEDVNNDLQYIGSPSGPPMPSSAPTTNLGAAGMGDVRSPYYDVNEMGSIPTQVYY